MSAMSTSPTRRHPTLTRRACLSGALAATTVVGGSVGGCLPASSGGTQVALSSHGLLYGGFFIAKQAGLFAKRGLQIKSTVMNSGNAAITALISNSVQFCASGPSEFLHARSKGQDLVLVSNLYHGLSGTVVVSRSVAGRLPAGASSPVADRLRALNGVTIAVPSATSAFLYKIKGAAESVGVTPKYIYMAQTDMPAALDRGAVEAFMAGSPFSEIPVANGKGVAWISGPGGEFPAVVETSSTACLQTTRRFADANPDVVLRVRETLESLASYIATNGAKARHELGLAYAQVPETILDHAFTHEVANWTAPQFSDSDVQREVDFYDRAGGVSASEIGDIDTLLWRP